ncbi:MAG: class IV adenylate cyclase [Gemmataceae bacterium]
MMLEIELKFRCPDPESLERTLAERGLACQSDHLEFDHYYCPPDRDFAATGEAFRLRRVGDANALTYKGPKRTDTTAKVRQEVELDLASGDAAAVTAMTMLEGLRYQPVAIVKKRRKSFATTRDGFTLAITLDACEGVGSFAEIEILAEEPDRERAEAVVHSLARELGLTDVEPRSYLRMTLEAQAGKPGPRNSPASE